MQKLGWLPGPGALSQLSQGCRIFWEAALGAARHEHPMNPPECCTMIPTYRPRLSEHTVKHPGATLWTLLANRVTPRGLRAGTKETRMSDHLLGELPPPPLAQGSAPSGGAVRRGASKAESGKHPKMGMKVRRRMQSKFCSLERKDKTSFRVWTGAGSSLQVGTKIPTGPQLRQGGSCCHGGRGVLGQR